MNDEPATDSSSGGGRRRPPKFRVLPGGDELPPSAPDRSPPHSEEAERHVIAVCLLDGGPTIDRCLREKLAPDFFYFPENRLLFEIILEMHQRQQAVSVETLTVELLTRRQLEAVGGTPYLMQLTGGIPTTAHAGYFIEKVREKWVLRRMVLLGVDQVEKTYEFTGGLADFVSRHALRLQRLADSVTRAGRPSQEDAVTAAAKAADEILAGKVDTTRRLSLGLPFVDQTFKQIDVRNEDWLNIIAAGPSGGKSSLMRFATGANCRAGKRGAVFLLETGDRRWLWTLAAGLAKADLNEILENPKRALPEQIAAWKKANAEVASWVKDERLFFFDDLFFIEDIERQIRELDRSLREKDLAAAKTPEETAAAHGLDFVVIDYLQLMNTREKIRVREEVVAHLTRTCKRLFKALDISGFVAAQINRKARDEGRRPKLSDLRESGAIEQDADRVIFVHTPPEDKTGVPQTGDRGIDEVELLQAKMRNGPRDVSVDVLFYKRQGRYQDAPRVGDARPGTPKPSGGYKREGQS